MNLLTRIGRAFLAAGSDDSVPSSGALVTTAQAPVAEIREAGDSLENPNTPLDRIFQSETTWAGKVVTENTALQIAAVWRCVNLIAGWVGRTPLNSYRRTDKGKERAPDHYLWKLFRVAANPMMTAYRFKRVMQTWALLWGNAYAEIEINKRGQVIALWPWRPDRVEVKSEDGQVVYTYWDSLGFPTTLPSHYVFHLRGLETDGMVGLSPIKAARQSLGLTMAAEEYGARFFSNSGKPGGWLEHPGKIGAEAKKNLRESIEDVHRGLRGAHRIAVFEEGMKYHDVGVPPEDMQFLQTRQFQSIDIARLFGVPPHKIAELGRATFSNIEHQAIEFFQDCLGDWFANWEAEAMNALLSEREAQTVFLEFFGAYLMKGDMLARYQAYNIGRRGGWLSANDIREAESMNRIEGGDLYLMELAMTPINDPQGAPAGSDPNADPAADPNPDDPNADDPPAKKKTKEGDANA